MKRSEYIIFAVHCLLVCLVFYTVSKRDLNLNLTENEKKLIENGKIPEALFSYQAKIKNVYLQ